MDAHLMGKQHIGFARIRSKIVELKVSQRSVHVQYIKWSYVDKRHGFNLSRYNFLVLEI